MHVLKKIEYCITRLLINKFISACKCKYKHFHLKKKKTFTERKQTAIFNLCFSHLDTWPWGMGVGNFQSLSIIAMWAELWSSVLFIFSLTFSENLCSFYCF